MSNFFMLRLTKKTGLYQMILIFLPLLILGCSADRPSQQNTKNKFSTVLDNPISLSEFNLTANDGSEFNVAALKDNWSLLFFGYTHCPDVCPLTLHQLSQARKSLSESIDELPNIIMISVDPDRDTTDILHSYVNSFNQPVIGATGLVTEIDKLTGQLGIFYKTNKEEGENYSVSHSAAVVMINKNAQFHAVFSAPHSTEHFISDLPSIMANN